MMMHLVIRARTGLLVFSPLEKFPCRVLSDCISFLGLCFMTVLAKMWASFFITVLFVEAFVQSIFIPFFQRISVYSKYSKLSQINKLLAFLYFLYPQKWDINVWKADGELSILIHHDFNPTEIALRWTRVLIEISS